MRVMLVNDKDAAELLRRIERAVYGRIETAADDDARKVIRRVGGDIDNTVRGWLREQGAVIEGAEQ